MTIDKTELSDEALVALFRTRGARDDRPFASLYRRHQLMVWRICYRFTGNAEDAEDLSQEVFMKAYRGLAGFEGRSTFKTWLHRIAVNTCQNEIRRRRRRPSTVETPVEHLAETLAGDPGWMGWDARHSGPDVELSLASLRPEEIEALSLRDLEQRSYAEIAEILGIGLSAAKMRVQRARLALQKVHKQRVTEEAIR